MCLISKKHLNSILSASLLAISLEAGAAQVLHGKPDDTLTARISRHEPTLIRIDGHRIVRVFGAEGDFVVTPDKDAGTAYIKPTTDKQSISAFVSDEKGRTWRLLLAIGDGPADTIVIRGKAERACNRDFARNQAIKQVLLALESPEETEFETRKTNELVPLWKEAMFVLVKIVEGPFRGEKYHLTNTSNKPMVIDEREFYRRGVVAVSVERHQLNSAETTAVYVISEATQ